MGCSMQLDNHLAFPDSVVAMLKIEGEGIVGTVPEEYVAYLAINKFLNMWSLWWWMIDWAISLGGIFIHSTSTTDLAPRARLLQRG